MQHNSVHFGTILGLKLRFDASWVIVFALLTWSLVRYDLPGTHPGWSTPLYWGMTALIAALFFASVVAHELAHRLVAHVYRTPKCATTLFIFGGTPQIGQEPQLPHQEVLVALAGPGMNLALATLFFEMGRLSQSSTVPLHALMSWLAWLNLMLFLVNLIPAFPLDGGRVLRAVIWDGAGNLRRATLFAMGLSRIAVLGLIFSGSWLGIGQLRSGNWEEGLWTASIGLILYRAITLCEQQQRGQDTWLLMGHTVRDVMLTGFPHILRRLTLDVLVDQVVQPSGQPYFLVLEGDHLHGLLSRECVVTLSPDRRIATRVEDVMVPAAHLKTVRSDVALTALLERMRAEGEQLFLVRDNSLPLGIISRETIESFLDNQSSLAYQSRCPVS